MIRAHAPRSSGKAGNTLWRPRGPNAKGLNLNTRHVACPLFVLCKHLPQAICPARTTEYCLSLHWQFYRRSGELSRTFRNLCDWVRDPHSCDPLAASASSNGRLWRKLSKILLLSGWRTAMGTSLTPPTICAKWRLMSSFPKCMCKSVRVCVGVYKSVSATTVSFVIGYDRIL